MRIAASIIVALAVMGWIATDASAAGGHGGGHGVQLAVHGHGGHAIPGRSRGHYDYVPGHLVPHRGHLDYVPGYHVYHRTPSYRAPVVRSVPHAVPYGHGSCNSYGRSYSRSYGHSRSGFSYHGSGFGISIGF